MLPTLQVASPLLYSASRHEGEGPAVAPSAGRGHILFDALTQFMKSSALKAMDEIVGFVDFKKEDSSLF